MKAQQGTVATTSISKQILPPNPKRMAVIFIGDTTTTFTVSLYNPAVALQGLVIGTTLNALQVTRADLGDEIAGPFFGVSTAGGNLTFIELMD